MTNDFPSMKSNSYSFAELRNDRDFTGAKLFDFVVQSSREGCRKGKTERDGGVGIFRIAVARSKYVVGEEFANRKKGEGLVSSAGADAAGSAQQSGGSNVQQLSTYYKQLLTGKRVIFVDDLAGNLVAPREVFGMETYRCRSPPEVVQTLMGVFGGMHIDGSHGTVKVLLSIVLLTV